MEVEHHNSAAKGGHPTSETFSIFVELFLGLITARALDTFITNYKAKSFNAPRILFLISLLVILFHSFSIFIKASAQQSYGPVLNQPGPRLRIRILFIATLFVFIVLYLMAAWFAETTMQFLVLAILLAIGWTIIDLFSKSVIKAFYNYQQKPNEVEKDPLFIATSRWWIMDMILGVFFVLLIYGVWKNVFDDTSVGVIILFLFVLAAVIVDLSLPSIGGKIRHHSASRQRTKN